MKNQMTPLTIANTLDQSNKQRVEVDSQKTIKQGVRAQNLAPKGNFDVYDQFGKVISNQNAGQFRDATVYVGVGKIAGGAGFSLDDDDDDDGWDLDGELPNKPAEFTLILPSGDRRPVRPQDGELLIDAYYRIFGKPRDGSPMEIDSSPNRFFRNLDGVFSDVTESSANGGRGFSQGLAVGDYDADGFPDLFVANIGRNQLLRNNGDGTFSDVTQQVALADEVWTSSAALADLDGDGLTDLFQLGYCETDKALQQLCMDVELNEPRSCAPLAFVAQKDRVWRGTADGSYVDVTKTWLGRHESGRGLGIVVGALDDRLGVDVYVANDMTANHYWSRSDTANAAARVTTDSGAIDSDNSKLATEVGRSLNRLEFRLSEQASVRGLAVNERSLSQASMGIAAGDADQDGDLDFLLTHFSGDYNTFYEQVASGTWADRSKRVGMIEPTQTKLGYGTQWIDADNDGAPELVVANGDIDDFTHQSRQYRQSAQLFQRQQDGTWGQAKSNSVGDYFESEHLGRAVAKLDANRDQKPDLVITHLFEPIALLVNETKTDHLQCRFFFVGTKSGRDAIGTRVTLQCEGGSRVGHLLAGDGFQCSNERCVSLGLGTQSEPCKVVVDWPDGTRESFGKHELSGDYLVIQGSGKLFAR